jgi:hypothetical protein
MFEQERPVDLLDVDAAILNWLDGIGDLQQLARSGVGVSESDSARRISWALVKWGTWTRLSSSAKYASQTARFPARTVSEYVR